MKSIIHAALTIAMVSNPLRMCMAFSRSAYFNNARRQIHSTNLKRSVVATSTIPLGPSVTETKQNNNDQELNSSFNPLGPPAHLSNLLVGETYHHSVTNKNITRLSSTPDIFLVRDLMLSDEDREALMHAAEFQGMKVAGTRESEENTIRKKSYLTWIDPHSLDFDNAGYNGDDDQGVASSVARETITKSRSCFAHETMNDLMTNVEKLDYCFAEDVQVAKYDAGGRFDHHHDGFSRYLTVLTYLNGVGGTYFPFGDMGGRFDGIEFDFTDEIQASTLAKEIYDDTSQCGILVVGKEGASAYLNSASTTVNPKSIINIQAGDAIAFYNYMPDGERDFRSLHCSLMVPQEKWIATCWFRSKALTGPFAWMKRAQLLEDFKHS